MGQDLEIYDPIIEGAGRLGPAMEECTPGMRRFVLHMLDTGMVDHTASAQAAGFKGNYDTMRVTGHRLAHHPKVQAAIQEEARGRIGSGAIMATSKLLEIAMNDQHKDQFKAVIGILNRSGLHETAEVKHTVTHTNNDKAMIDRIIDLSKKLNLDPKQLLGQYGVVLDAEFEEVKPADDNDLSDLLG